MYFRGNDMADELLRFEIKPSNESTLVLEVFKSGVLTGKRHIFFFENYSGEVLYAPAAPEKSSVRVSIESRSITCKDTWVKPDQKKHILSVALNDMLAADQFSQITFASTGIRKKPSSQYEVTGDLTIRGTTRPVTLQVALKAIGQQRLELDGDGEIRMKEYGLKPPSAMLGLVGTKDKMQLRFLVWAERANADANAAGG
jgi:polyisoprenoid-binding protein YceI